MTTPRAALGALALLVLSAGFIDPATADPAAPGAAAAPGIEPAGARSAAARGSGTVPGVVELALAQASPATDGVAARGRYVGNFYRMMVAYGGFAPAKEVFEGMCADQAPGLLPAVLRAGDLDRDRWCVARIREIDQVPRIDASLGERPTLR